LPRKWLKTGRRGVALDQSRELEYLGEGYGKHLGRRADMGIAFKLVTLTEGRS
jgi:hypothetical protein